MSDICGRFYFAFDLNADGMFTISDLGLILKQVFFLPTNLVVWMFEQNPQLVTFFEIDCSTGKGLGATIFCLFTWWMLFLVATIDN